MSIVLLEDDNLWFMTKRHMCNELGGERGGEKQAKKCAYQQRDKVDARLSHCQLAGHCTVSVTKVTTKRLIMVTYHGWVVVNG